MNKEDTLKVYEVQYSKSGHIFTTLIGAYSSKEARKIFNDSVNDLKTFVITGVRKAGNIYND